MPIVDSRHRLLFADEKPDRVCEWPDCPLTNYSGRKMKACSRCTSVRYCVSPPLIQVLLRVQFGETWLQSKDCQGQDWPYHKTICHNPSLLDFGGWIEVQPYLFHVLPVLILKRNFLYVGIRVVVQLGRYGGVRSSHR